MPEFIAGMTVLYHDRGVWGFVPPQQRVGKILEVRPGKYTTYLLVETPGINLSRQIDVKAVVGFCAVNMEAAAETISTAA